MTCRSEGQCEPFYDISLSKIAKSKRIIAVANTIIKKR